MGETTGRPTVAVVGAGPVGQVVAADLAHAGYSVTVYEISGPLRDQLQNFGIRVRGVRALEVGPGQLHGVYDDLGMLERDSPDVLFLCIKATAISLVCSALSDVLSTGTTVVSWQNGIDTEQGVAAYLPAESVVRAVVNYGVTYSRDTPDPDDPDDRRTGGTVHMSFEHPPHALQEFAAGGRERAAKVAEMLTGAGLTTEHSDSLRSMVWKKAILNAALNGLCGLTGMNMEAAVRDSFARELSDKILKESITVARANEIWLGAGFYPWAVGYLDTAGAHRPSMLMDLESGRRTEIDFINGKIVEYGRRAGVATPYNESILALVKAREKFL